MHTLDVADPAEFLPDNPAQRLPWILALALLLVLLGLIGFGRLLRLPARQPPAPKPLQARIYELPASRGAAAAKHEVGAKAQHAAPAPLPKPAPKTTPAPLPAQHAVPQPSRPTAHTPAASAPSKPTPKATPAPQPVQHAVHHLPQPIAHKPAAPPESKPVPKPTPAPQPVQHAVHHLPRAIAHRPAASAPSKPVPKKRLAPLHVRHHVPQLPRALAHRPAAPPQPKPKPATAAPRPPHTIDWSTLQSQIDAAVNEDNTSEAAMAEVHDPHTLVAHYYLASLLRKLQRIGNMNYPTDLIGVPVVDLLVGSDGSLLKVRLLRSSGNPALDRDALAIVRESAPFAPFPDQLLRQTSHIRLVCYMQFNGYQHINPIF